MSSDDEIWVGTETPFMVENITIDQRYVFEKKIKELDAEIKKRDEVIAHSKAGFTNIRKYSLGSKADTCDECLAKMESVLGLKE